MLGEAERAALLADVAAMQHEHEIARDALSRQLQAEIDELQRAEAAAKEAAEVLEGAAGRSGVVSAEEEARGGGGDVKPLPPPNKKAKKKGGAPPSAPMQVLLTRARTHILTLLPSPSLLTLTPHPHSSPSLLTLTSHPHPSHPPLTPTPHPHPSPSPSPSPLVTQPHRITLSPSPTTLTPRPHPAMQALLPSSPTPRPHPAMQALLRTRRERERGLKAELLDQWGRRLAQYNELELDALEAAGIDVTSPL